MKKHLSLLLILLANAVLQAQPINPDDIWPAQWIRAAEGPQQGFGVFHFRKAFALTELPEQLLVHTSGDNRYQLYLNGKLVTWGPQRGDLEHWYYETTDLRPFLQQGENTLAAVVWNFGAQPPDAQLSVQTAFVLCANDRQFRQLNTGSDWKGHFNEGVQECPVDRSEIGGYYGAGPKEKIFAAQYPWGWEQPDFDDSTWQPAISIESPKPKKCIWAGRWKLLPRTLPMETLSVERIPKARLAEGVALPEGFPAKPTDLTIPANQEVRLVLDQTYETTAYLQLLASGGKGSQIKVKYAEAPVEGALKTRNKGNRNIIEGKNFYGYHDEFYPDGGKNRLFAPLWWRAYRYLEISIQTAEEPLVLHEIYGLYTGYPFEQKADFKLMGENPPIAPDTLQQLLKIGERTMRLCSHETFMDCPYYEESQFVGDTRVEALVSYTHFGDARLGKNAVEQFGWSINSEGFLSARYPANSTYYIPNFSLFWIGMLYDYLHYVGEVEFITAKLPYARAILDYHFRRLREDGSVQYPDYHNFVDWSFPKGEAPVNQAGYSALVDLHFLMALQWAKALEETAGEKYFVQKYEQQIATLQTLIHQKYWQADRGLYADTPDGERFSQHTNSLCVLTGVVPNHGTAQQIMQKVMEKPEGMTAATLYWSFYLFEALHAAGLGGEYFNHLEIWKEAIAHGVTTWPETGLKSRSESHAWGSSPNYHFHKLVAGITPAAPGFEVIRIAPQLQQVEHLQCTMPHPNGLIKIDLQHKKGKIKGSISLPPGTTGTLHWNDKQLRLREGEQEVKGK